MTASERAAMRAALPAVDEDERASLIAEAMADLYPRRRSNESAGEFAYRVLADRSLIDLHISTNKEG